MSAIRIQWQALGDLSPERGSDFVSKKVPRSVERMMPSACHEPLDMCVSLLQPFRESGGLSEVTERAGAKGRGRVCLSVCLTLDP